MKESEKNDEYRDFAREVKKKKKQPKKHKTHIKKQTNTVVHESDVLTFGDQCSLYSHQKIGRSTGGLGNNKMTGDYPKYNIIKIGQDTSTGPGDSRRLTVTQTIAKDHQLMLMSKTLKKQNNDNKNNLICFVILAFKALTLPEMNNSTLN